MTAGDAWYCEPRPDFLETEVSDVVAVLSSSASSGGWHVEREQHEEWEKSVNILHEELTSAQQARIDILRDALSGAALTEFTDVILEYNFRRRGLRIDCILLAPGLIVVVEFKRSRLAAADRDQVTNYCINLVEFHEETRALCEAGVIVVPVLVLTEGTCAYSRKPQEFHRSPWSAVTRHPLQCDAQTLQSALADALAMRPSQETINCERWLSSRFSPSSTILDAAISLYGQHDVSAIAEHAAPIERIQACTAEIAEHIHEAKRAGRNRVVLVSGTPGSGKTLVGLNLAFDPRFREDAVFVTGNVHLVDVLVQALKHSYKGLAQKPGQGVPTGYHREGIQHLIRNATFKIVKAHQFLGERGRKTAASDGSIVIFDEAQRTYESGRQVAGAPLANHEADLILDSLERSYPPGAVVVALLGHNQAINRGERGAIAWFEAAERRDWDYAVDDQTLSLSEFAGDSRWSHHHLRKTLVTGHLSHSMRFYRNKGIEEWAHAVLTGERKQAADLAQALLDEGDPLLMTRDLGEARAWARSRRAGEERMGLIASAQGRRLAAEGLHVEQKPSITHWMLAPSGDVRSSNMLETVQNQYHIQGLELDYTIVCWDADLRRESDSWRAYKIHGAGWQRDKDLRVAKNCYRVLLTRARKGMVIFIPRGDQTGEDVTREPAFYDGIAQYLAGCGVQLLS